MNFRPPPVITLEQITHNVGEPFRIPNFIVFSLHVYFGNP
jgi:hypothetical protein